MPFEDEPPPAHDADEVRALFVEAVDSASHPASGGFRLGPMVSPSKPRTQGKMQAKCWSRVAKVIRSLPRHRQNSASIIENLKRFFCTPAATRRRKKVST